MEKDFQGWNAIKSNLDNILHFPTFKEREVWWCSIGVNVGHEENGKGAQFNRPVLVVKKFNYRLFWGVPLTTQLKDSQHYHEFHFLNKRQCAMLTQLRVWDAKRITHKMGRLSEKEFEGVRSALQRYLTVKMDA